jgi:cytochrome c553
MNRSGSAPLALLATLLLAWSGSALAVFPGSCANGKTVYNKTNGAVPTACSNSNCHGPNPTDDKNNILNGSTPDGINNALDGTAQNAPMTALDLRNSLPLSDQDISDLATWIFYAPACPTASPSLQAAPAPLTFVATPVGAASAITAVTITNAGSASATGIGFSNSNSTEFIVSGNTCAGATLGTSATCSFGVAFRPSASGARTGTLTLSYNSKVLLIAASGTGSSAAGPGQLSMNSSLGFGNQTVGTTSAAGNISLTNVGGSTVSVSSVSSNNPSEFAIVSSTCTNVAAGGGCAIGVTFTPGASGVRNGSITVVSSGTGSPQAVSVSGSGTTGQTGTSTVTVVEYHNAAFDHYFITPVPAEIALLDAKTPPFQDWSRTGFTFNGYANATAPAGSVAICRFFNSTFAPKSSHFYAPHGLGCEVTITNFPDWVLEDDKLFNSMLPDASGACPQGTIPVYRLYNNGMGGAPNHRFVTSSAERQNMINAGYVAEGAGIGVGMCAPQ